MLILVFNKNSKLKFNGQIACLVGQYIYKDKFLSPAGLQLTIWVVYIQVKRNHK